MTHESVGKDDLGDDRLMRSLGRLQLSDVDAARADLIRRRCQLEFGRPRRHRPWDIMGGALMAAACALYLAEVVKRALQLFGS